MPSVNRTRYTILGCLTIEPMSGYDIKQFIDRSIVHFWSESYGQLYPTLSRLEEEGLVEGREEPGERGRPKRILRITEAGRDELRAWLRKPAEPPRTRSEPSLKLFFGFNVGPAASVEHVGRLREEARVSLRAYREWEAELEQRAEADPGGPAPYWLTVLRGGIRHSDMVLDWCDEAEETLAALAAADGSPDRMERP